MNQTSVVLTTLLHYNVAIRDTLEYCLKKDTYDENLFKEKKRSVIVEVDENTPLKNILNNSGDNGAKLEKLIREFYEEVYGDKSTILNLASDGLRVDHNQHMAIYKGVLPIHENVNSMIVGIINDAHKKEIDVAEAEKVEAAEEAMFRAVCYMTLVNDLCRLFNEYNQARNEAKGEETPASRFIGNDIAEVIKNIGFVRQNARLKDAVYKNMEDKISNLVEYMTGRRDLPVGKKFPDVMNETNETIRLYVRDVEATFRAVYPPLVQALIDQTKAEQAKKEEAKA
ncbi:MAG: hypothetical protein IJS37_03435 [Bacilli bacterium]|nr:hypothetical protein [Bacilli bacterium]